MRQIFRREDRLSYDGTLYQIPYRGADATGLGKPLKSTLEAQPDITATPARARRESTDFMITPEV